MCEACEALERGPRSQVSCSLAAKCSRAAQSCVYVPVIVLPRPQVIEDYPGRPVLAFCIPLGAVKSVLDPGGVVQSIYCAQVA